MISYIVVHMTRYAETHDDRILNHSRHAFLVSH